MHVNDSDVMSQIGQHLAALSETAEMAHLREMLSFTNILSHMEKLIVAHDERLLRIKVYFLTCESNALPT
jgi:hypothetical protein